MTGEELKLLRKSKGLTQQQLADKVRVTSYITISKYEKGKVKITEPMGLLFEKVIESNIDKEEYDFDKTLESNLISKIRWGTDDELDDLAFWVNKWKLKL